MRAFRVGLVGGQEREGDLSTRALRALGRDDKKRVALVEMTRKRSFGRDDNTSKLRL